jgi:hypothetical protein
MRRILTCSRVHPAYDPVLRGLFPCGYSGRSMKLFSRLHIVRMLRLCETVPPPPYVFRCDDYAQYLPQEGNWSEQDGNFIFLCVVCPSVHPNYLWTN